METNNALHIEEDVVKLLLVGEDFTLTKKQWLTLLRLYSHLSASLNGRTAFIDENDEVHVLYLKE